MVFGIKYLVLSRPRIMISHICSVFVYILKFVTSTFIFREANAIFQILSLKSVFLGPMLYLVSFFVGVLLQIETSSIIKNLDETFLPNFF